MYICVTSCYIVFKAKHLNPTKNQTNRVATSNDFIPISTHYPQCKQQTNQNQCQSLSLETCNKPGTTANVETLPIKESNSSRSQTIADEMTYAEHDINQQTPPCAKQNSDQKQDFARVTHIDADETSTEHYVPMIDMNKNEHPASFQQVSCNKCYCNN